MQQNNIQTPKRKYQLAIEWTVGLMKLYTFGYYWRSSLIFQIMSSKMVWCSHAVSEFLHLLVL